MQKSSLTTVSISKGISFSLIGGFIGALVMGGVASVMPVNGVPFFVAAAMLMGMRGAAIAAGWALHIITGLIVGAIFGVVTTKVSKLHVTSVVRGLGLGVATGVVVWVVLFMPMMARLMPQLLGMPTMVGGSFAAHVMYGLILGGVVGGLSTRVSGGQAYKCESCGASFASKEELMNHGKMHLRSATEQQQYKCSACGAGFNSQSELMEHSKKSHPMAAH
jgi:DNA-directed RNA polymerase subunit RPC12/RpoP